MIPVTKSIETSPEVIIDVWKSMYFRAQAGMERYLVSNYGFNAIKEWVDYIAEASIRQSDAHREKSTIPFIQNLELIMKCWGSREVENKCLTKQMSELHIDGCGILEYRKNAREMGIELTFDDPCREYCALLLSTIARKQGLQTNYSLKAGGCTWCAKAMEV